MRTLGIIVAVAVLGLARCGDEPFIQGIFLDEGDAGTSVSVPLGAEVVVQLDSNITTGYEWELLEEPDPAVLRLADHEYESTSGPDETGGGGVERWTFETRGGGSVTLRMGYRRPWEDEPPVEEFSVTINVSG